VYASSATDIVIDINGYYGEVGVVGTSTGNTAVGLNALGVNTTGGDNTAFGTGALSGNTTGNGNAAFGDEALRTPGCTAQKEGDLCAGSPIHPQSLPCFLRHHGGSLL
jgi:hypothetical protein